MKNLTLLAFCCFPGCAQPGPLPQNSPMVIYPNPATVQYQVGLANRFRGQLREAGGNIFHMISFDVGMRLRNED